MDKFDFFGSISSDLPISVIPGMTSTKKSSMIQLSEKSQQTTLPPDLLIRILKYLPIASLPNFARACRRFKVLVYDDELWEQRLKTLGVWKDYENGDIMNAPVEPLYVNAKHTVKGKDNNKFNQDSKFSEFDPFASPPSSPTTPNNTGNLLDFAITTANSLIPGLPLDSFSQKSRAASTGFARSSFKNIFIELLPYYLDFRHRRKDSKLFKEYNDPSDQSKMLARLLSFGKLNITLDSEQINNALETTIEYFENSALHHFELAYNVQNISEMQKWATILLNLNGGSACIQVFIQKNSIFFDHLYDPMDNFTCLTISNLGELNYMQMTEFFNYVEEEMTKQASLINQIFPQDADVFYTFVERVVEDVIIEYITILLEESCRRDISLYLKTVVATHQRCIHVAKVLWKDAKPGLTKIRAEDLIYQMFEPFMDKYLKEELNYVKTRSEDEIEKWNQKLINKSMEAQQDILNNANREIYKRNYLTSFRKILKLPTARSRHSSPVQSSSSNISRNKRNSASSITSSNPTLNLTDLQSALSNAKLDKMQQMLSLETALQMVHVNKDSLRRVSSFTGYPDKMGYRIKETLESVFITLLQTLGPLHIKPAFNTAIKRLGDFKSDKSDSESTSSDLAPLVGFFELVHIADLIQQMVQVYYDEEMNKFIDKTDFLNNCNKEKKIFEKILDESVAAGLNKGIQVLIDHVEFILATEQKPEDFKPANDDSFDLQPTKACIDAVECLSNHTKLVIGSSDKHTLDVFFQEIGLRFFGTLTKHIKKFTVSLSGGFQVISDLNHYCSFIISLRQPNITPYFIALKELGNIYIISNARDIGSFVREADRFNGVLHAEDVYEFCQKREDWMIIKKEVDKELYGLKAEDCTIM